MKYILEIQYFGKGRSKAGGGGGSSGGKTTATKLAKPAIPQDDWPEEIQNAIGEKGSPMSLDDAVKQTNPHYSEGRQYKINCQRVCWAYELNRRGYNVEALPNETDWDGFGVIYRQDGYGHVFKDQTWSSDLGRTNKAVENRIRQQMAQWGEGARGFIRVRWKNGGGHVFNVEQRNGQLVAVDAQPGKIVNLTEYLSYSKPSQTMLSRVDNLTDPKQTLLKCFKQRGG